MKGAILKMKKKYSTAVAKRKKKASAKKETSADDQQGRKKKEHRSKKDETRKSSNTKESQQRRKQISEDTVDVRSLDSRYSRGSCTYASQSLQDYSRSFESYNSGSAHTGASQTRPSQHSRGRSPTERRPRRKVDGRDDASFLSGNSSYYDESSYYGSSYYSDEDGSWDSEDDCASDDGSGTFLSQDLRSDDEQTDQEYAENKLRDVGTVIRAAPTNSTHHRLEVVEDETEDDDDENSASVFSDGSNTITDKSLDSVEEEEFQDFLQKQREKRNGEGGGGFFWMLGFGRSHEDDIDTVDDATTTVAADDTTVGDTVLTDLPEEDEEEDEEDTSTVAGGDTDQDESVVRNSSESSIIKHDKTFETTQVKSGCFINFMGSHDSIDGSYGGLRDGDILIADSGTFDTEAAFTDGEDTKTEAVQEEARCTMACSPTNRKKVKKPKMAIQERKKYSDKAEIVHSVVEETPASPESSSSRPFGLFSFFEPSKSASIENLTSGDSGLRGTKIPLLDIAPSGSTLDETIVVHTIVKPSEEQEDEPLQHNASLEDDATSYGDSTIMTDQFSTAVPLFLPKLQNQECRPLTPLNEKERAKEPALLLPSAHSDKIANGVVPSAHSQQSKLHQNTNHTRVEYSQHGRKLTLSFHNRSNLDTNGPLEQEEMSQNDQTSQDTISTATYKEEFELELGSYGNTYNGSSSSSESNSIDDDGPKRKRAERLDNYDISEIVHGRRKFMPKPKSGGTLGTAYREAIRNESSGPPLPTHPLNIQASGGLRRERRLYALKAHRDFIYGNHNSNEAQSSDNIMSFEGPHDDADSSHVYSLQDNELSLMGCRSLDKVQPSGEWIEQTWQSLGPEEMERASLGTGDTENAKGESTASENSIAADHKAFATQAQKADALVDLVRTALNGMLSSEEAVCNDNDEKLKSENSKPTGGPNQQPIFVPDVFQAAYDFFGITSQEQTDSVNLEKDSNTDALRIMNFHVGPMTREMVNEELSPKVPFSKMKESSASENNVKTKSLVHSEDNVQDSDLGNNNDKASLPLKGDLQLTPSQEMAENATQSSPDITSHSDEAVLDQSSSKEVSSHHKNNDAMQFNVDGIPLELRPKKIWKAFDSYSRADAALNMENEVREAFGGSQHFNEATESGTTDADVDQVSLTDADSSKQVLPSNLKVDANVDVEHSEPAVTESKNGQDRLFNKPPKHAEILRFKSRRLRHVSRIVEKRQQAGAFEKDRIASKSADVDQKPAPKAHLPYSGDATAYRQHVMDIRSRLRHRRRTKIFRDNDESVSTPAAPAERRDDSSSNSDEFFDASSSVVDEKQQSVDSHEEHSSSESEGSNVLIETAPPKPTLRYELAEPSREPKLDRQQPATIENRMSHDSTVSESQRSRRSMYSAFSLD